MTFDFDTVIALRFIESALCQEINVELPQVTKRPLFQVLTTMYVDSITIFTLGKLTHCSKRRTDGRRDG